ncbi:MAG: ssDNA-binding protein [Pseudomonadota bacterium]
MSNGVRTPIGTLAFPHFFEPKKRAENKEPEYHGILIFDAEAQASPEFQELKSAVIAACNEKWPSGKPNGFKSPFRKADDVGGDGKSRVDKYDGFNPGDIFISPWSKYPPGVVGPALQDLIQSDVFAGQKARFTVSPFAYSINGNVGVGLMVNNVQITSMNEERLDGRDPKADFDAVEQPADTAAAQDSNTEYDEDLGI